MSALDPRRWKELLRSAGACGDSVSGYEKLSRLYAQPHRHYHNAQHIAECLAEFDSARPLAREPVAVELAIWFHDAIYDPRAADNEERSADLARECVAEAGLDSTVSDSVAQLVLATKRHDGSLHPDAPLLVDIDLSIFGKPADRFWEYEEQIRKEYDWVPESVFRMKRAEVLEQFLSRSRIFNTDPFFQKYEVPARAKLIESIRKLRGT